MVEDAAHSPIGGGGFGLRFKGRSIGVYSPVQVPAHTHSRMLETISANVFTKLFSGYIQDKLNKCHS